MPPSCGSSCALYFILILCRTLFDLNLCVRVCETMLPALCNPRQQRGPPRFSSVHCYSRSLSLSHSMSLYLCSLLQISSPGAHTQEFDRYADSCILLVRSRSFARFFFFSLLFSATSTSTNHGHHHLHPFLVGYSGRLLSYVAFVFLRANGYSG